MVRTAGMFNSNIGSLDFDAPHQVKPEVQSVQVTARKSFLHRSEADSGRQVNGSGRGYE